MSALERWQTAISSNLASGSVVGFKKDETAFSSAMVGNTKLEPGDLSADFKHTVPQASGRINDSQGVLRQTGKDLDFALQGAGYFKVRTREGGDAYTRNGEFHLDGSGKLVNNQGLDVTGDSGPIIVDIKQGPVTVDSDGKISQGEKALGKLSAYDLSKSGSLKRTGDGLFTPGQEGPVPPMENPQIFQGYVEESNVTPLQEMVNLIAVSRAYEVSQKLITTLDRTSQSAIESLGSP
jgi:flagellar basal-body rod protein FlgF